MVIKYGIQVLAPELSGFIGIIRAVCATFLCNITIIIRRILRIIRSRKFLTANRTIERAVLSVPLAGINLMGKTVKKVWNIITSVLVTLAVLLAIAFVGVRLVGLQVFTVLSGSMEPTYHTGSLIYVKAIDHIELKSGDVITFMLDENTIATHRIVEVVPDEKDPEALRFRTKGDANNTVDGGLVHYKNIIGTPVFSIPKLGYLANYIQNPPGMYIAISVGAILLLLVFLPDLFANDEEKETKKKKGIYVEEKG